jgi:hypothetical protein
MKSTMNDPLDISPNEINAMRSSYDEMALRLLSQFDPDPKVAIEKLAKQTLHITQTLMLTKDQLTQEQASFVAGIINMSITPVIIAQWRKMKRDTNRKENQ